MIATDLKVRLQTLCEMEHISNKKVIAWLRQVSFEAQGLRTHPLEIGRILSEGKKKLMHGQYQHWVESVLRVEIMCANNYRRAWECFGEDRELWDYFQLTAMYMLAGKQEWHSKAKEACVKLAQAGEMITRKKAAEIIKQFKPEPPTLEAPDFVKAGDIEDLDRVSAEELDRNLNSISAMLNAGYQLLDHFEAQGYNSEEMISKLEDTSKKLSQFAEFMRSNTLTLV